MQRKKLTEVQSLLNREIAREWMKEVAKWKWNEAMQDPINETFTEFLKNLKKTAKDAFGNEAENHIETSLFVS